MSRAEGGVHIHGNPHVTTSPINMRVAARNIATGLIKVDPEGREEYEAALRRFLDEIDKRLFGEELVKLLGGKTLCAMAERGTLIPFLKKRKYRGRPLIDYMGGWMKKMMPLRGKPIVTYHKNWIYFVRLFGLEEAGTIEPKPGIPPSPRHVTELISLMRERNIRIVLAANYFDEQKVRSVADSVDAEAVIVPLYVGGASGVDDYFKLVDHWTDELLKAARKAGVLPPEKDGPRERGTEAPDA
jgi:ABC-type Zn uptake system ZnuABC Zn-binding protein ZnuA